MNRIKLLRLKHDLTQQELAEAIGTTYQHVQAWEKGKYKPTVRYLSKLAGVFSVSIEELMEVEQ